MMRTTTKRKKSKKRMKKNMKKIYQNLGRESALLPVGVGARQNGKLQIGIKEKAVV